MLFRYRVWRSFQQDTAEIVYANTNLLARKKYAQDHGLLLSEVEATHDNG